MAKGSSLTREMDAEQDRANAETLASSAEQRDGQNASAPAARRTQRRYYTVDGPLGIGRAEAIKVSRLYHYCGYAMLPLLWVLNVWYFYPCLKLKTADPQIRKHVVQSKWNLIVVGTLFLFWMLLFLLGGKAVFGEAWETLSLTRVGWLREFMRLNLL